MSDELLVVVGAGARPYREYALAQLAARYRVAMVLAKEPTWQQPHLVAATTTDVADAGAIAEAVRSVAGPGDTVGLMTWDETVLVATATAATQLGLPHMSPLAAARCRDKHATRTLLAGTGGAVGYRLVTSAEHAVEAAESLGLPVVVKPRGQAGSVGVERADDADEVRRAFELAATARYATLRGEPGVLVEELLDGPEISIDSVVHWGVVEPVHVAHKRLGFAPCFEEVGHLVQPWGQEPWADKVRDLVVEAHQLLGIAHGVTHAEVRLTSRGPRLVELNGRLGGDLIPWVGGLATGVHLVPAAAELAFDRCPDLPAPRTDAAEVRFVYPPYDAVVEGLDLTAARQVPGIVDALALVEPGSRLRLPPVDPIPRLAALVATGPDAAACAQALDKAEELVEADLTPLPVPARA